MTKRTFNATALNETQNPSTTREYVGLAYGSAGCRTTLALASRGGKARKLRAIRRGGRRLTRGLPVDSRRGEGRGFVSPSHSLSVYIEDSRMGSEAHSAARNDIGWMERELEGLQLEHRQRLKQLVEQEAELIEDESKYYRIARRSLLFMVFGLAAVAFVFGLLTKFYGGSSRSLHLGLLAGGLLSGLGLFSYVAVPVFRKRGLT